MSNLIKELGNRTSDKSFKELERPIYESALLSGKKKVSKRYNLIQRIYSFASVVNDSGSEIDIADTEDHFLPLNNFISEYKVLINNIPYHKVSDLSNSSETEYVLERDQNQILFNYSKRSEKDNIKIYYTSDINKEDFDLEEYEPIIPSQYEEEVLSLALVEIAKAGIIKFSGSNLEARYRNILKIYSLDERSLDRELLKNEPWVEIKPYNVY